MRPWFWRMQVLRLGPSAWAMFSPSSCARTTPPKLLYTAKLSWKKQASCVKISMGFPKTVAYDFYHFMRIDKAYLRKHGEDAAS